MSERERLRRADPARTAPIRDFSNLYRRRGATNVANREAGPAPSESAATGSDDGNPAAQAVELGYRVIESYLRAGREAAGQFNSQPYATGAATRDKVPELLDRIARSYSEMLPIWFELAGSLVKINRPESAESAESDIKPSANGASNNGFKAVAIEVMSSRPVRVSLELRDPPNGLYLMTHGLRAVDPAKPPLTDICFLPADGSACSTLRISIPERQPPGNYSGVIVDREKGETRGILSVRIAD